MMKKGTEISPGKDQAIQDKSEESALKPVQVTGTFLIQCQELIPPKGVSNRSSEKVRFSCGIRSSSREIVDGTSWFWRVTDNLGKIIGTHLGFEEYNNEQRAVLDIPRSYIDQARFQAQDGEKIPVTATLAEATEGQEPRETTSLGDSADSGSAGKTFIVAAQLLLCKGYKGNDPQGFAQGLCAKDDDVQACISRCVDARMP